MSLFVEVNSIDKNCPVIINLDSVIEIAPLAAGGCALFTLDSAGMNSKNSMRVTNDYSEFKQFAMQTVSAEDIERRFPTKASKKDKSLELEIPKL
jgi:hypothetical protein